MQDFKKRLLLEKTLAELETARTNVQKDIRQVRRLLWVTAVRRRGLKIRRVCSRLKRRSAAIGAAA